MKPLPVGTFVEICRGIGIGEVCVVECTDPLMLRPATVMEKFRLEWRRRRCKAGEMASACDARYVIEQAMGREKA